MTVWEVKFAGHMPFTVKASTFLDAVKEAEKIQKTFEGLFTMNDLISINYLAY